MRGARRLRRGGASVLAVCLAACAGEGESGEDSSGRELEPLAKQVLGPVRAELSVEAGEHRFGDRVTFQLSVWAEEGVELEDLDFGARMGHFRIRDREDRSRPEDGVLEHVVETEAERTGVNLCRPPAIAFTVAEGEGAGERHVLRLPVVEVPVQGLEDDEVPQLAELGEPLAPVGLPERRRESPWSLIAILAAVIAGGCGAFLWWRRRGRGEAAPVVLDPAVEAEGALRRLLERDLILQGRFGEFYLELTAIVRRYLERTTGIHAVEQTTEEFLREAEDNPAVSDARRQRLRRFLEASDFVKFAAQVPSATEVDAAVESARAFCRPDRPTAADREDAA